MRRVWAVALLVVLSWVSALASANGPIVASLREAEQVIERDCIYPIDRNHLARLTLDRLRHLFPLIGPGQTWQDLETAAGRMQGSQAVETDVLSALLGAIGDPFSRFSPPDRSSVGDGAFSGIGVGTAWDGGRLLVVSVLDGSPADLQHIHRGDLIETINSRKVEGMLPGEAESLLEGRPGAAVVLHLHGSERVRDVRLVQVWLRPLALKAGMCTPTVGLMRIAWFGDNVVRQMASSMTSLRQQGATTIILDLRDNPGGIIQRGQEVAGFFMGSKPLVRVLRKGNREEMLPSIPPNGIEPYTGNLVILVNRGTASTAELLTAGLREQRNATVVGSRTYGKNVLLTVYALTDGSLVSIPTGRATTPNGQDWGTTGIQPDVPASDDKAMDAALSVHP